VNEVRITGEDGSYVGIKVSHREFDSESNFWDGNWLVSSVDVRVGRFRARVDCTLRADEFASFRDSLRRLFEELRVR
jgi:hypothetical protein